MKTWFLTAVFAVVFMLSAFLPTAHAEPLETDPPEVTTSGAEIPDTATTTTSNPFTPGGTGTVMDHADDEAGKVFYTITTPDGQVFYLVIDRERNTENVYFLNTVTENDLMALAVPSEDSGPDGSTSGVPDTPTVAPSPETPPDSDTSSEPAPQQGGNGTLIFVIVLVVLGGGAGWYFKIYRPKHQRAANAETEFEPPDDEENADEWGDSDLFDGDSNGDEQ